MCLYLLIFFIFVIYRRLMKILINISIYLLIYFIICLLNIGSEFIYLKMFDVKIFFEKVYYIIFLMLIK